MNLKNLLLLFLNKQIIGLLLLSLIVLSCKKEEIKPLFSNGVIKGRASLYSEEYSNPYVYVELTGPYNSRKEKIYKDPNSSFFEYQFDGLGNGTYKVTVSRDSFGSVDCYNIQTLGNDTIWASYAQLYKVPEKPVIPTAPVYSSQDQFYYYFSNAKLGYNLSYRVFMSTRSDVTCYKYLFQGNVESAEEGKIKIQKNTTLFEPSTKVYFIIYASNLSDYGYYNSFYNLKIFSSIDPKKHSQIFSATMN